MLIYSREPSSLFHHSKCFCDTLMGLGSHCRVPESRVKVRALWRISLRLHPGSLLLTVLRRCFWCNPYVMLFGVGVFVVFYIAYSVVNCLNVNFNGKNTFVEENSAIDYEIMWFLFGWISSFFRCLGLFYCGSPWAFFIITSNERL